MLTTASSNGSRRPVSSYGTRAFTRGQTQVLYRYLPQAIFEHDDYGLCKVEAVAVENVGINSEALFDALADALVQWSRHGFAQSFPDPRTRANRGRYLVGSPREVRFAPYPLVFLCRRCGRVASYLNLARAGTQPGRCWHRDCGGALVRLRYVQAHNCGRLEDLKLPDKGCPRGHGREHVAFYDPGRVRQARWYCRLCNSDIQGLRMTPCKCAYSQSLGAGAPRREKWLKVVPTGDPSLYLAHSVALINLPEEEETRTRTAKDALELMLARAWGLLAEPVHKATRAREASSSDNDGKEAALLAALREVDPRNPLVLEYDAERKAPRSQGAIDHVRALVAEAGGALGTFGPPRWLVEHTTLLDRTRWADSTSIAAMLRRRGDTETALVVERAHQHASDLMGIGALRLVDDFPLALCAFGYTRTARDPARAEIKAFPPDDQGKIPLYAVTSETEAVWMQLRPEAVASWLVANGLAPGQAPPDHSRAWAWLYGRVPGLGASANEPEHRETAATAVRTLLHTIGHVFLRRIEWSGFAPSSIGEYLIPGALSIVLYANRYAESKIGGLTTLFEQRLDTWLWDAVQSGTECIYDPLCTDDGGSCAGCTHREHNCLTFNRELSRAVLYGGPTPQGGELAGMSMEHGFWEQAWRLPPER